MNVIPGGLNLLRAANKLIGFTPATHRRWKANEKVEGGDLQPVFFAGEQIAVSIQPVGRQLLEQMGFDLQKDYVTIYSDAAIKVRDVERGTGADLLIFEGKTYQAESNTPWLSQNGWRGTIFVMVGKC